MGRGIRRTGRLRAVRSSTVGLWARPGWTADGHVPLLIAGTVGVIAALGMGLCVRSSAARVRSGSRRAAVAACEAGSM